jgi:MYXO-CTERM domain-containing protein
MNSAPYAAFAGFAALRVSAVAFGAAALVGLSARPARAFCREISQLTPAGYDPATLGCYLGNGASAFPVYWKNACVTYSLEVDASAQISLADAKSVAALAFGAWSQVTCSGGAPPTITASELEPPGAAGVSCTEVQYNPFGPNQNVIVFRDQGWPDSGDPVNTLGLTTITYDSTDGEIYDADMEINSHDFALVAYPPAPSGGYDLLSIMTHEAGHFFGLAHSADTSAVMYAFYHAGEMALTPDDVNGICAIYAADGTRATSSGPIPSDACCAIPRHGFDSICAPEDASGKVIPPPSGAPETALVSACSPSTSTSTSGTPAGPVTSAGHSGGCSTAHADMTGETRAWIGALVLAGLAAWRKRHRKDACRTLLNESI